MKKRIFILILLVIILMLGYILYEVFFHNTSDEGKFNLTYDFSVSSGLSDGTYGVITVNDDAKAKVVYKNSVRNIVIGEETKNLTIEEFNDLKEKINQSDFFSIPKDISDHDILDGGNSHITIEMSGDKHTVGGSNPRHENYNMLEKFLWEMFKLELEELRQEYWNISSEW